jgi:pimeloyl-ACP methyl ester carboxylesterase
MPFATASDGTRLAYEVTGDGPALLLVAGQSNDRHIWHPVRDAFAASYRVVTFDHRGTGDSGKPDAPPYTTRGFAADAIAVLDDLRIDRAHAYGMSMGGRIGQWLGIDHASRLGALVLGCTTPGNAHGVRRSPDIDPVLLSGDPVRLQPYLVTPAWAAANPGFLAEWEAWVAAHPVPPHARQLHYGASEGHDAWDQLPRITAPTLLVHGSDDELNVVANAHLLAERIPGAAVHIIPGARHLYFWDHAEEAHRVVAEFLARHPL